MGSEMCIRDSFLSLLSLLSPLSSLISPLPLPPSPSPSSLTAPLPASDGPRLASDLALADHAEAERGGEAGRTRVAVGRRNGSRRSAESTCDAAAATISAEGCQPFDRTAQPAPDGGEQATRTLRAATAMATDSLSLCEHLRSPDQPPLHLQTRLGRAD